jgi:hypothetical protein
MSCLLALHSYGVGRAMIRFLYTDDIDTSVCDMDTRLQLLRASNTYGLPGLKERSVSSLAGFPRFCSAGLYRLPFPPLPIHIHTAVSLCMQQLRARRVWRYCRGQLHQASEHSARSRRAQPKDGRYALRLALPTLAPRLS